MIPKLRQDPNCDWQILTMRPGSKPFDTLAQAIANCNSANLESIALDIELVSDPHALTQKLAQIRTPHHRLLLFIDQFEELFTQVAEPAICQKFLQSLADAVRNAPNFTLVFTLRDDFSSKLQNNIHDDDFRPLLERYRPQPLVGMTRDRLKAAIIEPVAKRNVEFEGGLVDRLVEDVGNDAGSLPLLQLVLDLLWQHQQPRLLTHQAYDDICGEKGLKIVLANLAEKIYDGYVKQDKVKEFKQVILRLVTLGDGNTPNTRRIATHADIGAENWRKIVAPLSTERLLKTNLDQKTQKETVEVIHETLIQSWQRLTGWIEDYRHELERIAEIESAAIKWDRHQRSKQDLWGGKKLKEAWKFSKDRDRFLRLESIANDFLSASGKQQLWNRGSSTVIGLILPTIVILGFARQSLINSSIATINSVPDGKNDHILSSSIQLLITLGYDLSKLEIILKGKNFNSIILRGVNLQNIHLEGAHLEGAHLEGAHLEGAYLKKTHLEGAYLENAHLKNADLENAYLEDTHLKNADLLNTNFTGVDLSLVNIEDTDISKSVGITIKQVEAAGSHAKIIISSKLCDSVGEEPSFKYINNIIIERVRAKDCIKAEIKLKNLTFLDMHNAQIKNENLIPLAWALGEFVNLTHLDLSNNRITTFPTIGKPNNITNLDLSNNQIISLSGIENFTNLTHVNLSNNRIVNIELLKNLPKLTDIKLDGNPIISNSDDIGN